MNELSDAELLIRSRTDVEAFGLIYRRYAPRVHGYLARRLGRQTADDLLSQVFMYAVEGIGRARPHENGSALPWLYGIAHNVVRRHLRNRPPPARFDSTDDVDWDAVDARADASAASLALRAAVASLPSGEREVLLLVSWEQLSPAEAAVALGIAPSAARQRLHRARAHAAAALAAVPHPYQTQEN